MAHLGFLVFCIFFCAAITLCSAACGQLLANTVSSADRQTVLNKHNSLRTSISEGKVPNQPKGINLKTLLWDDKLAQEAQKIANTCEFGHVGVNDGRFYVGQNIAWSGSSNQNSGADWSGITELWFNEHVNFTYPSTSRGVTGHYTQVVWADTYLLGCGYSAYHKDFWYEKLYVCNYGPGGNYAGQAPYKI